MLTTTMRSLVLGAAILVASSAASWATSTVHVSLMGDAGDKMLIELDTSVVPAGTVTFDVKNAAIASPHEMLVIKLKHKNDKIPMIAGKHRIDEDKLKSMGEVSELEPGASGELVAKLKAGDYLLLCNVKGHFEAGMSTPFTVTK